MPILWLVIVGAAAGFLATRLMRIEAGIVQTVLLGMAGALIGGLILRFILTVGSLVGGLVGAVLGAMLLIWLWQRMRGG
ncbi:GlsB/YeaQ/YmgE family stress response membrane protein [Thalassococcus sp. BH17M4-6]|uniref:GlsB/YeaQ/YmgE family stress response membrane protein n=1 Tax=Thalassococcus sp. BH17M4-6 TaxID=3413148 RepID=UPI003BC3A7F9